MLNDDNLKAALQAVLFSCGEPVDKERLAVSLGISADDLAELAGEVNDIYDREGSPFRILRLGSSYQMATRKEFAPFIKKAMETKKDTPLSHAAMEVLTIVAYNQPVSKSFVSHVRGIESGNIVNSLVERELLEEAGRLDVPGKPIAYKTTEVFLRCFGMESLDELIPVPESVHETVLTGNEDKEEQD